MAAVRTTIVDAVSTIADLAPDLPAFSEYPSLRDTVARVARVALTRFAVLGFGVATFTANDLAHPRDSPAPCPSRWECAP